MTPQHPAAPETETDANGLLARVDWMDLWWQMTGDDWPVPDDFPGRFAKIVAGRLGASALLADLRAARERVRVVEGERDAAVRSKAALVAEVQRLQDQIARASMEPGQDRQKAMHAYAARAESAEAAREAEKAAHERLRAEFGELADDFASNVDWSAGRGNYGDNEAWESAARQLRALLDGGGER